MQRTSNRIADDEAFGEGTAVVRAMSADSKEPIPGARQQHLVLADTAEQRTSAPKSIHRHARSQIGRHSVGSGSHHVSPSRRSA